MKNGAIESNTQPLPNELYKEILSHVPSLYLPALVNNNFLKLSRQLARERFCPEWDGDFPIRFTLMERRLVGCDHDDSESLSIPQNERTHHKYNRR